MQTADVVTDATSIRVASGGRREAAAIVRANASRAASSSSVEHRALPRRSASHRVGCSARAPGDIVLAGIVRAELRRRQRIQHDGGRNARIDREEPCWELELGTGTWNLSLVCLMILPSSDPPARKDRRRGSRSPSASGRDRNADSRPGLSRARHRQRQADGGRRARVQSFFDVVEPMFVRLRRYARSPASCRGH